VINAVTESVTKDTTFVEIIKLVAGRMRTVGQACIAREMLHNHFALTSMSVIPQTQKCLEQNFVDKILYVQTPLAASLAHVMQVMKTLLPGKVVLTRMNVLLAE
jgi:hypothetical protein